MAAIAYQIKATNAVLLIAVMVIEFLHRFHPNRECLKRCGVAGLVIVMCIGGTKVAADLAYEQITGVQIDYDRNKGMVHYFKMGLNEQSVGTFDFDDDEYSEWAHTCEERNQKNLRIAMDRISEMGPIGVSWLYLRKTKVNYNDGSFGFALNGTDFVNIDYARTKVSEGGINDGSLCEIKQGIQSVYRPDGASFARYLDTAQGLWLALLVMAVPAGLLCVRERQYLPILLTTIGAWMFTMIFECQQRYMFIFAPLYIVLGMSAASMMARRFKEHL